MLRQVLCGFTNALWLQVESEHNGHLFCDSHAHTHTPGKCFKEPPLLLCPAFLREFQKFVLSPESMLFDSWPGCKRDQSRGTQRVILELGTNTSLDPLTRPQNVWLLAPPERGIVSFPVELSLSSLPSGSPELKPRRPHSQFTLSGNDSVCLTCCSITHYPQT